MFFTEDDLYDPELIGAAFLVGYLFMDAILDFIEDGELDCE